MTGAGRCPPVSSTPRSPKRSARAAAKAISSGGSNCSAYGRAPSAATCERGPIAKRASFTRSVKESGPAIPGHGKGPPRGSAGSAGLTVSRQGWKPVRGETPVPRGLDAQRDSPAPRSGETSRPTGTWQRSHQNHRQHLLLHRFHHQQLADLGQRPPRSPFRELRQFRVWLIDSDPMKTARKPTEATQRSAPSALSIDIDPLVEVVRRHVKLNPQTMRLIKGEFAQLFRGATISGSSLTAAMPERTTDTVLTTQEAADLAGVSRPYIVARIEAGDIPLHQQVGNQRRVLQSAVLAWNRQEQTRRRKALGQLGADLDSEIFAD